MTLLVTPRYYDFFSRSLMPVQHYWPVRDDNKCASIKYAVDWVNSHKQLVPCIYLYFVIYICRQFFAVLNIRFGNNSNKLRLLLTEIQLICSVWSMVLLIEFGVTDRVWCKQLLPIIACTEKSTWDLLLKHK